MAKNVVSKNWSGWIRASDGYLRSDDPLGLYGSAEQPRAYVTTAYMLPSGNTWTATNTSASSVAGSGSGNRTDCSLSYALTNCVGGDIIKLTKGATYTGNYTIPNKAGTSYVYVVSTGDPDSGGSGLPAYGLATANRVSSSDSANMAKIISATANLSTLVGSSSAHHFRFVGIEFASASTNVSPLQDAVCKLNNGDVSNSTVCNNIIFDRCYIHGSSATTNSGRRGLIMAGEHLAVVNSYISGFYDDGNDSQGVFIYQGNGPFCVRNNYIEAASENLLSGGSDPAIANSVPQDIEIRHNYFFKPLAWIGAGHNVKNLLEFKNARRVLVEGNKFENVWPDGQAGYAFLITPRNQDGTAPWCETSDITIQYNKFYNCGQWFTISGQDTTVGYETLVSYRILVQHNLVDVTGLSSADAKLGLVTNGPKFLTIKHNTGFSVGGGSAAYLFSVNATKATNFIFKDNIFSNATAGCVASGLADGTVTLDVHYSSGYVFTKNAIIGGTSGNYTSPATGNFFPANVAAVSFTSTAGAFAVNDYTLTGGSAYHNAASDGTDLGANIAALNAAIA